MATREITPAVGEEHRPHRSAWHRTRDLARVHSWTPAAVTTLVVLVVGGIVSPGFASWSSINQIVAAAAILAIACCGQSLVMVSGDFGIDLSVGQVMSLTALASYMAMATGHAYLVLGLVVALAVGGALGLLNGLLVTFARLPALVVTLGTLVIAQGGTFMLTKSGTPNGTVPTFLAELTTKGFGEVKYVTIVAIVFLVLLGLFVSRSRFGKMLYMVGSNREASRLSGLPVARVVILTFAIAGACSGFAGFLLLSYAGTANLDLGSGYLVLTIAATVIGGTSLAGGEGNIAGAALGALAFQVVSSFMLTLGASEAVRLMVIGLALLLLLAFNARTPKLSQ